VLRHGGSLVLLVAAAGGEGHVYRVGRDGRYHETVGTLSLVTAEPVRDLTSFATDGVDELIAAADGAVIRFRAADGPAVWRETGRQDRVGPGPEDRFGSAVCVAADAGRLWIADSARHRVLCTDLAATVRIGQFGMTDESGDRLDRLDRPTALAVSDRQAVVWDSGNQRIVRMELAPDP
jgi:hypothetical protein